jgi:hypothetical protein
MSQSRYLANATLWAAAIIAAAIAGAPEFFTIILLPVLAVGALLVTWPSCRAKR